MKEISINNRALRFIDEGTGFPVLLGHSFLFDHRMWQPQIDELSKHYRVIAPDLWGHGQSDTLPENYESVYDIADDMWSLLQALNIDKVAVVGLSIGGMWGTKLALSHPEHVVALGLFGTSVAVEPQARKVEYDAMFDTLEEVGIFEKHFAQMLLKFFFSPHTFSHRPELPKNLREWLLNVPERNIQSIISIGRSIFARQELLSQLDRIGCPTLVVVGKDDVARPPQEAKEMASRLQNVEYHEIEHAGHISSLEQPDRLNDLLLKFLPRTQNR